MKSQLGAMNKKLFLEFSFPFCNLVKQVSYNELNRELSKAQGGIFPLKYRIESCPQLGRLVFP